MGQMIVGAEGPAAEDHIHVPALKTSSTIWYEPGPGIPGS